VSVGWATSDATDAGGGRSVGRAAQPLAAIVIALITTSANRVPLSLILLTGD
jgi:hypothetical protein